MVSMLLQLELKKFKNITCIFNKCMRLDFCKDFSLLVIFSRSGFKRGLLSSDAFQ